MRRCDPEPDNENNEATEKLLAAAESSRES
jgi:hypothetical protein